MQNAEKVMEDGVVKPPLGLIPRRIWHKNNLYPSEWHMQERIAAIERATARYNAANMAVPPEWAEELLDISQALRCNISKRIKRKNIKK